MRSPLRTLISIPVVLLLLMPLDGSSAADDAGGEDVLLHALELVDERYWRPGEVHLEALLASGLQQLEHAGDPVLVTGPDEGGSCTVAIGEQTIQVETTGLQDVQQVVERMRRALAFIDEHLEPDDAQGELPDLEVLALQGLLKPLDRHCRVIDEKKIADFNARYRGTLVGIGAKMGRRNDVLTVLKVYEATPAQEAGLLEGDVITAIDGVATLNMKVGDAIDRIRGPAGLAVTLTIRRSGESGRRTFTLVRRKVVLPTIEERLLDNRYALLVLDHFSQKTADEFLVKLLRLEEKAGGELGGVIIDLRNNKGGSMLHSARIVNFFLNSGEILQTQGASGGAVDGLRHKVVANTDKTLTDVPVVVLVNHSTASGSEILAGGLKFNGRALVMGTQTFGKGTVQKPYELREKLQMKLTVARYLVAQDVWIADVGITPDIRLEEVYFGDEIIDYPDLILDPEASTEPPHGRWRPTTDGTNAQPEMRMLYPYHHESKDGYLADRDGAVPQETPFPIPQANDLDDLEGGWHADLLVALATRILATAEGPERSQLLAAAGPVITTESQRQQKRLIHHFEEQGINWADIESHWMDLSPQREEADREAMLQPPPKGIAVKVDGRDLYAGETTDLVLRVTNRTGEPLKHLRARTVCDRSSLDGLSFVIGDLGVGRSASFAVPIEVSRRAQTRMDRMRLYLINDDGPLGGAHEFKVITHGSEPPRFAMQVSPSVELIDDGSRMVRYDIDVLNEGVVTSGKVRVSFANPGREGVEIQESHREIVWLDPGGSDRVVLQVLFRPGAAPVRMVLKVRDVNYGVGMSVGLHVDPQQPSTRGDWYRPPEIGLDGVKGALSASGSMDIEALAKDDEGMERMLVWLGRDKIELLEATTSKGTTTLTLDSTVPIEEGINTLKLEAVDATGIRSERRYVVLGQ